MQEQEKLRPRKGQCAYYEPEKLNKTGGKNGRRKMRT